MTPGLWAVLFALWAVLALAVLWWGATMPAEDEGRVQPGADHAEVVARMRLLQGGRK